MADHIDQPANAVAHVGDYLAAHQKRSADYPSAAQPAAERIHAVQAPGDATERTLTATDLSLVLEAARWALAEQEWRA